MTKLTSTNRRVVVSRGARFQFALLVAVSIVLAGASCFASVRHPRRAREAYARAVEMQKRLEAHPVRSRTVGEYKRVIREFRAVYYYDFAYSRAPVAAETIGDLYAEMGRVFSNDAYFHDAIKAYHYLISQYPRSSMARDARVSEGKVYLEGLQDTVQAADVFRSVLEKHPSSSQADAARKNLKEIADMLAEQKRSSRQENASEEHASSTPVEVTEIHDWVGPGYTRVVIGANGPFKYDTLRLSHPDRIVFDLANTRLNRALLRDIVPIDGDFLRDIRVGQFKPNVTRVVLDVQNIEDYSAFPLPNPYRLIIDVHGTSAQTMREASYREASVLSVTPVLKRTVETPARPKAPAVKRPPVPKATPEIEAAKQLKRKKEQRTELASNQPILHEIPISTRPASPTANGDETLMRALGLKVARIVIDPGHGGFDTGTIGPTGLEEKNVALDIALRLRRLFETRTDYRVFMTRSTDKFIPLEERTAIANEDHADLFISIHANASPDHHVRGIATYFLNFTTDPAALKVAARENATSQESVHQLQNIIKKIALNNKIEESRQLARDVQNVLYRRMSRISRGIHNRGVRKAPFVVLIGANMPSILIETGFLSNPHTERLLRKPSYREQIAKGIFRGAEEYINNLGSIRLAQRTR